MIKIQYASDLHLEFAENGSFIKHHPLLVNGDVLVLAGDIGYIGDKNYSKHPFWDWAADNYEMVIVIPGNHEFYKMYEIDNLYNGWSMEIRTNVLCYYNKVVKLSNDTELIATTLWSHIKQQDAFQTELAISDFRRIKSNGNNPLTWLRFNEEHNRCVQFLKESVSNSSAQHILVASHHVPSFEMLSPEFKGSIYNGAFTVELGDYIAVSPIEYWIYGHSHRNIDRIIGNTKCVTNQLGYVFHNEHLTFDPGKFIEFN